MADVTAVRKGLETRMDTISGLRNFHYLAGTVSPPASIVVPGVPGSSDPAITFDATFGRGSDELLFTVFVLVSSATDRSSQDNIDAYLAGSGAKSVKAAIEGDEELGGLVSFARVAAVLNYGLVDWAGQQFLGAQFKIEVTT